MRLSHSTFHSSRGRCRRNARGFTLLEVLVSILILSFGVLGAAGMQIASLQANKEARYQATAARLARQYADMMRGNKALAIQNSTTNNPFLIDNVTGTLPSYTMDCMVNSCASTLPSDNDPNAAKWLVKDWILQLQSQSSGLPDAKIVVCFDDSPYAGTVPQWACSSTSATQTAYLKIGWTQTQLNANGGVLQTATKPMLVFPVIAGNGS